RPRRTAAAAWLVPRRLERRSCWACERLLPAEARLRGPRQLIAGAGHDRFCPAQSSPERHLDREAIAHRHLDLRAVAQPCRTEVTHRAHVTGLLRHERGEDPLRATVTRTEHGYPAATRSAADAEALQGQERRMHAKPVCELRGERLRASEPS